jgi:hypothetical protein
VIVVLLILEVARPGGQRLTKSLAAEIVASSVSFGIYFAIPAIVKPVLGGVVFGIVGVALPLTTFSGSNQLNTVLSEAGTLGLGLLIAVPGGAGARAVLDGADGRVLDPGRSAADRPHPDRRGHRLPHYGRRQVPPGQPQAGPRSRGGTGSSGLRTIEIWGHMAVSIFPCQRLDPRPLCRVMA